MRKSVIIINIIKTIIILSAIIAMWFNIKLTLYLLVTLLAMDWLLREIAATLKKANKERIDNIIKETKAKEI